MVPSTMVPNAVSQQCPLCNAGPNNSQINGFVSPAGVDMVSCIDHDMHMLQLESDAPSRNSNSSNSDATSSDHSSPPNTPILAQNNYTKSTSIRRTSLFPGATSPLDFLESLVGDVEVS